MQDKRKRVALACNGHGSSSLTGDLVFVPLRTRGCAGYSYWIENRIRHSDLRDLKGFLTLTINPAHFCCAHRAWMSIWSRWNSLRTAMKKKHLFSKYFCVIEPTKKFRPHFHIMLDSSFLSSSSLKYIHKAWGAGIYYRYVKVRSPIRYLLKYMGKHTRASEDDNSKLSLFHAYLRAFKIRQWSSSRGLIAPYHKSSDKAWEYAGLYDSNLVSALKSHSELVYCSDGAYAETHDLLSSHGNTSKCLEILPDLENDW